MEEALSTGKPGRQAQARAQRGSSDRQAIDTVRSLRSQPSFNLSHEKSSRPVGPQILHIRSGQEGYLEIIESAPVQMRKLRSREAEDTEWVSERTKPRPPALGEDTTEASHSQTLRMPLVLTSPGVWSSRGSLGPGEEGQPIWGMVGGVLLLN